MSGYLQLVQRVGEIELAMEAANSLAHTLGDSPIIQAIESKVAGVPSLENRVASIENRLGAIETNMVVFQNSLVALENRLVAVENKTASLSVA